MFKETIVVAVLLPATGPGWAQGQEERNYCAEIYRYLTPQARPANQERCKEIVERQERQVPTHQSRKLKYISFPFRSNKSPCKFTIPRINGSYRRSNSAGILKNHLSSCFLEVLWSIRKREKPGRELCRKVEK